MNIKNTCEYIPHTAHTRRNRQKNEEIPQKHTITKLTRYARHPSDSLKAIIKSPKKSSSQPLCDHLHRFSKKKHLYPRTHTHTHTSMYPEIEEHKEKAPRATTRDRLFSEGRRKNAAAARERSRFCE